MNMKLFAAAAGLMLFGVLAGFATAVQAADVQPSWAYGFAVPPPPGTPLAPPNPQPVLDTVTPLTVPGSTRSFTRAQISNRQGPADWFPEDHPVMPEIVARGRETSEPQKIWACALCHYPNGKGRPENANITGLTNEYFLQQESELKMKFETSTDVVCITSDEGDALVPGTHARAVAEQEANTTGKLVTIRNPVTDEVLATIRPVSVEKAAKGFENAA